jgi:membrane-associated phospholipid phosphatase
MVHLYLKYSMFLCVIFILPLNNFAQSPYEMNWKKDGALIVIGIPLTAVGISLDRLVDPLTQDELNRLSRDNIFTPDRFVSFNYSESAAELSDILIYTCLASPLLLLTSKTIRNDAAVITGMYLESIALGVALPAYGKGGFRRIRPYAYNKEVSLDKKLTSEARKSFFSGHTTISFTSMVYLSLVYSTYYPQSNVKPYIWTGSLLLASTVGYLRIAAGSHFLTDVLVGAIVGSAIGYVIPKIHETANSKPELQIPNNAKRKPVISFQISF